MYGKIELIVKQSQIFYFRINHAFEIQVN